MFLCQKIFVTSSVKMPSHDLPEGSFEALIIMSPQNRSKQVRTMHIVSTKSAMMACAQLLNTINNLKSKVLLILLPVNINNITSYRSV